MGGTGGDGGGIYTPPVRTDDDCSSLDFTTNLQSIPGAPTHERDTLLRVVPITVGSGTAFVAIDSGGAHVGTIVERVGTLIRCTAKGVEYEAQVQDVDIFGIHTVRLRATR